MKTIIITLIATIISTTLYSQKTIKIDEESDTKESQEVKTLFKKEKRDGFYYSLSAGYSPIDNKNGVVTSMRGCWIMDHFFAFGLGGTAFINELDEIDLDFMSTPDPDDLNLAGGYGGLIIEPMIFPLKPIHLSFPILVGVGGACTFENYSYFSSYNISDFFWVVEPMAELEVNFTQWLRFAIYAGYRYTSELEIQNVSKDALRGYSAGLTLKVGLF